MDPEDLFEKHVNEAAIASRETFIAYKNGWRYCDNFGTLYNVVKSDTRDYPVYLEIISEDNPK